jgi:hypothetical protein
MADMDIKTFVSVASRLPASQAVLIRGPHGIGKSQLVGQIASESQLKDGTKGLPLVDRRLAQMTEGDIIGLPELCDGVTRFCPVDWILRACREPVVLLLDELNRATVEVQQCAFQLVLDRELNGHRLHPETRIFCAVNASPEYQINEMDPALLDRFWTVDLEPTTEDWIEWATEAGVDDVLIDFIRHYPAHLRHVGSIEPGKIYPSPRSYEKLDTALASIGWIPTSLAGNSPPEGFYALSTGYLGVEASIAFRDFVQDYEAQISAEDILDGWKKSEKQVMALSTDKHNALIEKIVDNCKENEWSLDQAKNATEFIRKLSGEMIVGFFNSVMETNNVPNIRAVHKFIGMLVVETVTKAEKA